MNRRDFVYRVFAGSVVLAAWDKAVTEEFARISAGKKNLTEDTLKKYLFRREPSGSVVCTQLPSDYKAQPGDVVETQGGYDAIMERMHTSGFVIVETKINMI